MHKIDIEQLEFIDKKMRAMMDRIEEAFGPQVITSLSRMNDKGVHGVIPLRGIDLRCDDKSRSEALVKYLNSKLLYDNKRPKMKVAIIHDTGLGEHIHLQVHPNTKEKKNDSKCRLFRCFRKDARR